MAPKKRPAGSEDEEEFASDVYSEEGSDYEAPVKKKAKAPAKKAAPKKEVKAHGEPPQRRTKPCPTSHDS
jgi:hypothetical protein